MYSICQQIRGGLLSPGQSTVQKSVLEKFMVSVFTSSGEVPDVNALIANSGASVEGRVNLDTFLAYISGEASSDRDARSFLQANGVPEPSAADLAYVQEQGVAESVTAFVKTMVKMKPVDLNRFGTEYFSGALEAQKRLVLIASDAGDIETLKTAVRKVGDQGAPIITAVWNYDSEPSDLTKLVNDLVSTHGTFKTIAMVCHDGGGPVDAPMTEQEMQEAARLLKQTWKESGSPCLPDGRPDLEKARQAVRPVCPNTSNNTPTKWFLTCSHGVDLAEGKSDPGIDEAFQAIADAASVRLDILACSLAGTPAGKEWVSQWEKRTKTNFAASTNVTGNADVGGDWVLETDGIDACEVYFHMDRLKEWEVTLGKGKHQCLQCDGTTNYNDHICGSCKKKGKKFDEHRCWGELPGCALWVTSDNYAGYCMNCFYEGGHY